MEKYEEGLHWGDTKDNSDIKISFWQYIKLVFLPLLFQVVCVLLVSMIDPCNNNPGCMAGSITAYSAIIILPATLVIMSLVALFEMGSKKINYYKALRVNSIIAIFPFILVFVATIAYS